MDQPPRNTGRRQTVIWLGLVGLGYVGWRLVPSFREPPLVFEPLAEPPGFRRVAGGEASRVLNPFIGLAHLADDGAKPLPEVRTDICGALFGDAPRRAETVPIASFSDYYCPYCRAQTQELAALEADSGGRLQVNWHELPLLGDASEIAARAALAAKRQGAYPEFHRRLMSSAFRPTPAYLRTLADEIGVEHAQFLAEMEGRQVAQELDTSAALGRTFGFMGTPAMVIGRTVVLGRVSAATVLRIAEQERKEGWRSVC